MSAFTPQDDVVREAADAAESFDGFDQAAAVDAETGAIDTEAEVDAEVDAEVEAEVDAEAEAEAAATDEPVAFTELGLPEELVKKLADNGVQTTFPIQAATIPDALAGRHVLGKARTGSGKTLAFGLAALANLKGKRARKGRPLALVLVPTRELAMQVTDALQPYGFAVGADIAAVFGGAPMYKQVFALRRGVELLVATPGRLTDLIEQEECDLSEVEIAILDEADQMADMGFMPIVSELLSQTDPAGQRLLFSATLDGAVDELVRQYMTDPVLHSVTPDSDDAAQMDHHLLIVEPADKALVTAEIAARHTPGDDDGRRTILFARTKLGADRIAEKIREAGVSALALHGGMTQRARTKTLADFKDGRVPVLVATDVAARGIHVDGIDLVLHVDPAGDPKDYLHRAGRTARAGESGTVVTLVLPKQRKSTMRLLESAGVEAELTRVAPSSDTLRELTGGRPVAEYVAEADAYHAARRAAREARMNEARTNDDRRESRGGRDGYRGGRGDFRQDRDRFDRGPRGAGRFEERDGRGFGGRDRDRDRGGFGGERSGSGSGSGFGGQRSGGFRSERGGFGGERSGSGSKFGGDRGGFGGGERSGSGFRGERSGSKFGGERTGSGSGFRGERSGSDSKFGGERGNSGFGGERSGSGFRGERGNSGFGGERRSFGDRDSRGGFGDRDSSRGGFEREGRGGYGGRDARGGERRSFGDRDGSQGRGFDRNSRGGSSDRSGGFGGERRSYGERDSRGGERRSFGERGGSQGRGFDRNSRGGSSDRSGGFGGDRDSNRGRGFDRDNRDSRDTRNGSGERRSFGDRNGSQNRDFGDRRSGFGQRGGFDGQRRHADRDSRDNRNGSADRDTRPGERRPFGERTAFGRPRGGYSNDRDTANRPPRDRRW